MPIKTTIETVDNDQVTLKTESGQLLKLPRQLLPIEITLGQAIYLTVSAQPLDGSNNQIQAKDILNEILKLE